MRLDHPGDSGGLVQHRPGCKRPRLRRTVALEQYRHGVQITDAPTDGLAIEGSSICCSPFSVSAQVRWPKACIDPVDAVLTPPSGRSVPSAPRWNAPTGLRG